VLGVIIPLPNRVRNFPSLAETDADTTALVTHDNQGAKAKPASAFHDLGGAVDENDLLTQLILVTLKKVVAFA
jgi:hypothetical protein